MVAVLLSGMTKLYGSEQFFEGFIRVFRSILNPKPWTLQSQSYHLTAILSPNRNIIT